MPNTVDLEAPVDRQNYERDIQYARAYGLTYPGNEDIVPKALRDEIKKLESAIIALEDAMNAKDDAKDATINTKHAEMLAAQKKVEYVCGNLGYAQWPKQSIAYDDIYQQADFLEKKFLNYIQQEVCYHNYATVSKKYKEFWESCNIFQSLYFRVQLLFGNIPDALKVVQMEKETMPPIDKQQFNTHIVAGMKNVILSFESDNVDTVKSKIDAIEKTMDKLGIELLDVSYTSGTKDFLQKAVEGIKDPKRLSMCKENMDKLSKTDKMKGFPRMRAYCERYADTIKKGLEIVKPVEPIANSTEMFEGADTIKKKLEIVKPEIIKQVKP